MKDHMREVHKVDIPKRASTSGQGGSSSRRPTSGGTTYYTYTTYS